jgi:deoxyribonuclease V
LGLRLGLSAVGCAKSLLYGKGERPPEHRGAWRSLLSPGGEEIGARVRTRRGVQEVYVSAGHRIDLEMAIHRVLAVSPRYRIPEPIRLAHRRTNEERRRLGI